MRLALLLAAATMATACAGPPDAPTPPRSFPTRVVLADTTYDAAAAWDELPETTRVRYRAMLAEGDQDLDRPPFPAGGMAAIMANLTYPSAAVRNGIEGRVVVLATVGGDGTLVSAEAEEPVWNASLAEAAVAAVRQAAFHPAERGGVPVEAAVAIPIVFRLD